MPTFENATAALLLATPYGHADRLGMNMLTERVAKAVEALRSAGHQVEDVPGTTNVYRVNGGDAVTGTIVLALAIRLGLMDEPTRRQ